MIVEGLFIMAIGMGMVFLFLLLMVWAIQLSNLLVTHCLEKPKAAMDAVPVVLDAHLEKGE